VNLQQAGPTLVSPAFHQVGFVKIVVSGCSRSLARSLLLLQRITLVAGAGLLAWPLFVVLDSGFTQWSGKRMLSKSSQAMRERIVVPDRRIAPGPGREPKGRVLGRFEVPRLHLSYVVLAGTDSRTLDKSIGLVEGTSAIGEAGNIGIAGHRNTHFRKLEWIRRGDEILLSSPDAKYRYIVEWIRVFQPADIQVLDHFHGPALTLVTCFPFEYVGSAPLRFIVRALPDVDTRARLRAILPRETSSSGTNHD
jgi:LPXTG-site transpeptidase (sortase) family protein